MKPSVIFYDLEIEKAIPPRDGRLISGIEYCKGWDDHANMGIAVLCVYDFANERPIVICKDNLSQFVSLIAQADYLVGFNNYKFDNRVIHASTGIHLPGHKCVDLLREIWKAEGLDPDRYDPKTHGGLSLDAICTVNLDRGKSGNGADAPIWWQRGQIGKVVSYCLLDVMLTMHLWRKIVNTGEVIDPRDTSRKIPVGLSQFDQKAL